MRIALTALVFAVLMVNGEKPKPKANADAGNTSQSQQQTVTVVNQQTPEGEQGDHAQKPPSYLSRLFSPENLPNITLVLVAAITALFIAGQAREMKNATEVMRGQLTAMQGQIGQMESSGVQTTALIAAAQKSADAAKISADIAARVSVPTLVVEKFELGNMGNANIRAILQLPKLNIVIRNYGQTPAFLHSWSVVLTCEELPAVPVYFGHPGSGNVLDKMVVQPNQPYTLPDLPSWQRQGFEIEDIEAILSRQKTLSVYGYVCYGDIFGSPLKKLKFGEFALNIGDNWIEWCDMADPVYCGTDLYLTKGKGTKVEAEPAGEKAN